LVPAVETTTLDRDLAGGGVDRRDHSRDPAAAPLRPLALLLRGDVGPAHHDHLPRRERALVGASGATGQDPIADRQVRERRRRRSRQVTRPRLCAQQRGRVVDDDADLVAAVGPQPDSTRGGVDLRHLAEDPLHGRSGAGRSALDRLLTVRREGYGERQERAPHRLQHPSLLFRNRRAKFHPRERCRPLPSRVHFVVPECGTLRSAWASWSASRRNESLARRQGERFASSAERSGSTMSRSAFHILDRR
jgi:hypothetical protein